MQLPNAANFGFDYYWACWLAVLAYLPGEGAGSRACAVCLHSVASCACFNPALPAPTPAPCMPT